MYCLLIIKFKVDINFLYIIKESNKVVDEVKGYWKIILLWRILYIVENIINDMMDLWFLYIFVLCMYYLFNYKIGERFRIILDDIIKIIIL